MAAEMSSSLRSWLGNRKTCSNIIKSVLDERNRMSYFDQSNISSSSPVTSLQRVTKAQAQLLETISELCESLDQLNLKMNDEMINIEQHWPTVIDKVVACDGNDNRRDYFNTILEDMKQQHALELCVRNEVLKLALQDVKMTADQDQSITMLACFTYPPYLHVNDINLLIDLLEN